MRIISIIFFALSSFILGSLHPSSVKEAEVSPNRRPILASVTGPPNEPSSGTSEHSNGKTSRECQKSRGSSSSSSTYLQAGTIIGHQSHSERYELRRVSSRLSTKLRACLENYSAAISECRSIVDLQKLRSLNNKANDILLNATDFYHQKFLGRWRDVASPDWLDNFRAIDDLRVISSIHQNQSSHSLVAVSKTIIIVGHDPSIAELFSLAFFTGSLSLAIINDQSRASSRSDRRKYLTSFRHSQRSQFKIEAFEMAYASRLSHNPNHLPYAELYNILKFLRYNIFFSNLFFHDSNQWRYHVSVTSLQCALKATQIIIGLLHSRFAISSGSNSAQNSLFTAVSLFSTSARNAAEYASKFETCLLRALSAYPVKNPSVSRGKLASILLDLGSTVSSLIGEGERDIFGEFCNQILGNIKIVAEGAFPDDFDGKDMNEHKTLFASAISSHLIKLDIPQGMFFKLGLYSTNNALLKTVELLEDPIGPIYPPYGRLLPIASLDLITCLALKLCPISDFHVQYFFLESLDSLSTIVASRSAILHQRSFGLEAVIRCLMVMKKMAHLYSDYMIEPDSNFAVFCPRTRFELSLFIPEVTTPNAPFVSDNDSPAHAPGDDQLTESDDKHAFSYVETDSCGSNYHPEIQPDDPISPMASLGDQSFADHPSEPMSMGAPQSLWYSEVILPPYLNERDSEWICTSNGLQSGVASLYEHHQQSIIRHSPDGSQSVCPTVYVPFTDFASFSDRGSVL